MPSYATIFRTHVWDDGVCRMAQRAQASCRFSEFIVAADETRGELAIEGFQKLSHTDQFPQFALAHAPRESVLWWNADYVLFAARRAFPDHEYYVMLEYDVFVSANVGQMVDACARRGVDLVAHDIKRIAADNPWFRTVADLTRTPWWAFIPFVIISGRAIDALLRVRLQMTQAWNSGAIANWPFCEAFIPSVIALEPGMRMAELSSFLNADRVRYRPFMSLRNPSLAEPQMVAHPVLSGQRFLRAFVSSEVPGSHVMTDGRLRPELQHETAEDLRAVFQNNYRIEWNLTGMSRAARDGVFRVDLARNKPATQSSHSVWSVGVNEADDARRANCGELADDYAFHTDVDVNPWWQVDLLRPSVITEVEIVNRASVDRFRSFQIDGSSDGVAWSTHFTKFDASLVSSDPASPAVFPISPPLRARYVRIVQLGTEALHLRRVRMFGRADDDVPRQPPPPPEVSGPTGADLMQHILADEAGRRLLAGAVAPIVHTDVFGRRTDSYNIDSLAPLAAAIDSSQYAAVNMAAAKRCTDALELLDLAAATLPGAGMLLEFGVFSGGSINHLAHRLPERRICGFDSFEGLPEEWRPGFPVGAFARSGAPAVRPNVDLVTGWFDQTLPKFVEQHPREQIALLHVDCDLYSSTKTIFAHLGDRIVPGTIIVFDEYFNYPEWRQHEFKAFQELVRSRPLQYSYIGLVAGHQQVCVRVDSAG